MLHRLSAAVAVIAALVLGTGLAAWGHVTVSPGSAPKGGTDQELTFRVPNEDPTASVTGLDMQIPTDHPLLGVEAETMPGWKVSVKTSKLAKPITTDDGTVTESVSEIVWTGGSIPPHSYGDFRIIVGQLPSDTSQLKFPAIQAYSGGKTVSWIEDPAAAGQPAPEHPAPILTLTDSATGGTTTSSTVPVAAGSPTVAASPVTKSDLDAANTKATVGIAIGALGIVTGIGGIVLGRRRST